MNADLLTDAIAPYWCEERQGVMIPLLNLILDAKNISVSSNWMNARKACKAAGKRMFTKEEALVLLWQRDSINAVLQRHKGDILNGWIWTDTEHQKRSADSAWCVSFRSGFFSNNIKYYTGIVRAVSPK